MDIAQSTVGQITIARCTVGLALVLYYISLLSDMGKHIHIMSINNIDHLVGQLTTRTLDMDNTLRKQFEIMTKPNPRTLVCD